MVEIKLNKEVIVKESNESFDAFYTRVLQAIADMEDVDWQALPVEVQDWYNEAAEDATADKSIRHFPGVKDSSTVKDVKVVEEEEESEDEEVEDVEEEVEDVEAEDVEEEEESEDVVEEAVEAPKVKVPSPKKSGAVRVKAPKKEKKEGDGTTTKIIRMIVNNPTASKKEIASMLETVGVKFQPATLNTCWHATKKVLEILGK